MAVWSFRVGSVASVNGDLELNRGVTGRYLTRKLTAPDEIGFELNGRQVAAGLLAEYAADVWVSRDGVPVARCRVLPTDDTLTDVEHRVSCKAYGYESLLDTRFTDLGDVVSWVATDQAAIAWNLVALTQGRTGGGLGITKGLNGFTAGGVATTGVLRDRTYEPDQQIGRLIRQLAEVQNGFDVDIDHNRQLQVYYPLRGTVTNEPLQYGGNVSRLKRSFAYRSFANAVVVSGGQGGGRSVAVSGTVGTDPRGRVEARLSLPSVTQDLPARATSLLADKSRPVYTWQVEMRRGMWRGFAHINVGDTVRLVALSPPRLNVNVQCRVHEISVKVGESGEEDVSMKLEQL